MIQPRVIIARSARQANAVFLVAGGIVLYALIAGEVLEADVRLQVLGLAASVALVGCAWCILAGTDAANLSLAATLTGCAIVLALGGSVSSVSHDFADDAYRYPRPYTMFTARPGAELPAISAMSERRDPTRIGVLGVRVEDESELLKRPGLTRIVMLGGSTVFNGTPLSHSIPGLLEARLGKGYRVFNFGVTSYVSGQEFDLMAHHVQPSAPEIVITYDGGNDVISPYFYDPRPGYPYNFTVFEQGFSAMQKARSVELVLLLVKDLLPSKLLPRLTRAIEFRLSSMQKLRHEAGYGSAQWEELIVDAYISNLGRMCSLAKGSGFRYIAYLQPLVHFKEPRTEAENVFLGDQGFRQYISRQYERLSARFAALAKANGKDAVCEFHDLSRSLEGVSEEIYWDYIHTTNRGNEIIADRIHETLKASI